jgi:hypothetical protein
MQLVGNFHVNLPSIYSGIFIQICVVKMLVTLPVNYETLEMLAGELRIISSI